MFMFLEELMVGRRSFLSGAGGVVVGGFMNQTAAFSEDQDAVPEIPWGYTELDVEEARKRGQQCYYSSNCASGVFQSLISMLRETLGEPYTSIPLDLYDFGGGGIAGWGTLCGTLNSANGVITLVAGPSSAPALVNELMGWYTGQAFPTDASNAYGENGDFYHETTMTGVSLPSSVSISPLCHVSVSKWCESSGFASASDERKERCARLTGDVAAKTAELLNAFHNDTFTASYQHSSETISCLTCHTAGESFESGNMTMGKMNCISCHAPHDEIVAVEDAEPVSFELHGNFPNPFNPSTTIEFTVTKTETLTLEIYNILGQNVRTLLHRSVNAGNHRVVWDGRDDTGLEVGPGMYIARLVAGENSATNSMLMLK